MEYDMKKQNLLIDLFTFWLTLIVFFLSDCANTQTFDFIDQFDVARNSLITSEAVTITGLSGSSGVTIINGEYSINGGDFTSAPGTVTNLDQISARVTSSSNYGSVVTAQVNIGGISASFSVRTEDDPNTGWALVPTILARINPPVFPDKDFSIINFGAIGDGLADCTEAFRNAIEACHNDGGGRVVEPI